MAARGTVSLALPLPSFGALPSWLVPCVYKQTLGNRQSKQHLHARADMQAHRQARRLLGCQCAIMASRCCVPGPPCPMPDPRLGMVQPALPRSEERCPGPDHCLVSLQIVLPSWTVCSCAFVGLAPCGLGLSWDQQGREAAVPRGADTGRLLDLLLPGPSCSRDPPAPQLEEPRYSDGSEALLAAVALDSGGCPHSPGPGGAGPAYLHQHLGCARPCRTPGG